MIRISSGHPESRSDPPIAPKNVNTIEGRPLFPRGLSQREESLAADIIYEQ
jgi:hypothetical protein